MDLSILYRVLWKPNEVFRSFIGKLRPEPYILLILIVVLNFIKAFVGDIHKINNYQSLITFSVIRSLFFLLFFPTVYALIIMVIERFVNKGRVELLSWIGVFLLCKLPLYIAWIIKAILGYPVYGLGYVLPISLRDSNPFLYLTIATITPFFIWTVILMRAALNQLLDIQYWQKGFCWER